MVVQSQFIEMFGNGNWEQRSLGEVGTFKRGGGFQKSDYVERGIPCIHYGQIHTVFGPFIYSHISEISSDLETKTKYASKGDLIIAITSEDAEGSCKSTAWLGAYPVAVGAHAAIYNHSMNPLYMSFFFKSELFNHAKMEYIHGTKVVEIRPDDIAKILVPCPPMSLQEQFSSIAEQADKSKFNGFKSRFIEMFGDGRYGNVRLGDYTDLTWGDTNTTKNSYVVDGYLAFSAGGPDGKLDHYDYDREGIVLSAIGADCGKTWFAEGKWSCIKNTIRFWSTSNDLDNFFLFLATKDKDFWPRKGGAQPFIPQGDARNCVIPLPPLTLQHSYIAFAKQADKSKYLS